MDRHDPRLRQIWAQQKIPVVYRQAQGKPLLIRLPYDASNRQWLKDERRNNPEWLPKPKACWQVPRAWFEDVIRRGLIKYGKVYVIQPFNTHEQCAPACWNALGPECECSCMGKNHGSGNPAGKWHTVSETLAVKWGERQYSCRLLTPYR